MSRRAERALLGLLAFVAAAGLLILGSMVLSGDPVDDLAAGGPGLTSADPAAGSLVDGEGAEGVDDGQDGSVGRGPLTVTASTLGDSTASSSLGETTTTVATSESDTSASSASTATAGSTDAGGDGDGSGESTTTVAAEGSSTSASISTTESASPASTSTSSSATTSSTTAETTSSSSSTTARAGLSQVEREVIRLTNQLRDDPSGPLQRVAPMPGCVNDEFYDITIDEDTGHPVPVPRLQTNNAVSEKMSRDWAIRMAEADTMSHRSNESQSAIYTALGIDRSRSSENVAWLSGYPESATAIQLFVGWRESTTGHYCSLVAGSLTHIGVGHHRTEAGKDWAAQNFYATR